MKAALTAALSVLCMAAPALAETVLIQSGPAATCAPTVLCAPAVVAPACPTQVLTQPAVLPAPRPYAFTQCSPNMDYSMDYTWEINGPYSELIITGG